MQQILFSAHLIRLYSIVLIVLIFIGRAYSQQDSGAYLLRVTDETDRGGYVNAEEDTIIQPGKYMYCYTDTFKTWAAVMTLDGSIIAIDRAEKKKFTIYNYDNGPDYPANGLFRIVKNGKIGYANTMGEIVIKPRFACAFPFEDGIAKVSRKCSKVKHGEHSSWESDHWFYIDTSGRRIKGEIK